MRHFVTLSLTVFVILSLGGCWTQFDPPPPPDDDDTTGDDDDTAGDDDDTTGDDDDSTGDDDDTTGDDDDTTGDDDDATGPAICSEAGVILCGQDFPSNNSASGSTQQVLEYGCSSLEFTGPEYALRWEATQSDPVTVTVSGLNAAADLDLFVLEDTGSGCEPTSCVTSANGTSSTELAVFTPVLGQTYYFVVDGYSGSISDFTMNLDCNPPAGDDDDSGDDDDDDTSSGDDDDSAVDCADPVQIVPTITMTDSSGQPTTTLSPADPLTLSVSIENQGGDSGTTNFVYPSDCIFSWSLWYSNGNPVTGGPICSTGLTVNDYTCGSAPVTGTDVVIPIEGVSGNPVPAGTYNLQVDTVYFGVSNYSVTVP